MMMVMVVMMMLLMILLLLMLLSMMQLVAVAAIAAERCDGDVQTPVTRRVWSRNQCDLNRIKGCVSNILHKNMVS